MPKAIYCTDVITAISSFLSISQSNNYAFNYTWLKRNLSEIISKYLEFYNYVNIDIISMCVHIFSIYRIRNKNKHCAWKEMLSTVNIK